MAQPKSRQQRTPGRVRGQGRRTAIAALVIVITVAGLVVGGLIGFANNPAQARLPPYLDRCVPVVESGAYLYHSHLILTIIIEGVRVPLPSNIGNDEVCFRPIHTHSDSINGTIHIETDENRDYTLEDFFLIWGKVFNGNQILDYKTDANHKISMTVNGTPEPRLQDYVLPRDAESERWSCYPAPADGCNTYNIVISYSTM